MLERIGHVIYLLYQQGIVHGCITLDACGKFEDGWKLMNLIGCQFVNQQKSFSRFHHCAAPEAVKVMEEGRQNVEVAFHKNITASYTLDIWAFGKLMYEALVGKALFMVNQSDSRNLGELRN